MAKLVLLPLLAVLLATYTSVNAYGVVRVDVQKDSNTVAFANAINNAITTKIQSLNTFWNSLFQAKLAYGTRPSSSSGSSSGSSATASVNYIPIYQKTVRINSGYVAPTSSSGQVAERITPSDDDVSPGSSSGSAVAGGRTVVTVNKSLIPSVSVSTSPIGSSSSSDSAADAAASSTSGNTASYTYRKRYISN